MHLVHDDGAARRVGRIVETEAYRGPQDLAAHSSRGHTAAHQRHVWTARLRVRLPYLRHLELPERRDGRAAGKPQAVLLRALAPVQNSRGPSWGPGLLCRAMHIDRA